MIGLWRESDRLALTSDCFYTLDPQTGLKGHARVPHAAFNEDTEQARASIRKLAELEPASAWPGHADPLRGDVQGPAAEGRGDDVGGSRAGRRLATAREVRRRRRRRWSSTRRRTASRCSRCAAC